MKRRYILLGLAAVFALAAALPAVGAPSPQQTLGLSTKAKKKKSSGNSAAKAVKIAKQAKKDAQIAHSVSNQALAEAKLPGPPGAAGKAGANGTARGYAETKTPGSTVALVTGRTKNFTTVTWKATGIYCLTVDPASGIDPAKVAAVASPEASSTDHGGSAEVLGAVDSTDCPGTGQLEAKTYKADGTASDNVTFNVIVP
jgi:hypothetical protein